MVIKNKDMFISLAVVAVITLFAGCQRDINMLEPAAYPAFSEVFIDNFAAGLDFSAFANSKYDAAEVDNDEFYAGVRSIRITVPGLNDPSGWFAGGAFFSTFPRDLSGYNALTFWAKASQTALTDVGFGNDNTGNAPYQVMQENVLLGTSWQKYIIPFPLPAKLGAETGMFQYAAGADGNGYGCTMWFDEIKFEHLNTVTYPRITLAESSLYSSVGTVIDPGIVGVTFAVNGSNQTVAAAPAYFTIISLHDSIAAITEDNKILGLAEGTATVQISLGDAAQTTLTVFIGGSDGPVTPAPVPLFPANRVISLFSDMYTDHSGIIWNTNWQYSTAVLEAVNIAGNEAKLYTNLNFVGIEFTNPVIDASAMTHFHIDIWTPDPTASPKVFKIKLVDFGANGVWSGGDDSEHELTFRAVSGLASESWVSFDIPLSDFTGLTSRSHLAQLVLSGDLPTVYVDNVFFHN